MVSSEKKIAQTFLKAHDNSNLSLETFASAAIWPFSFSHVWISLMSAGSEMEKH